MDVFAVLLLGDTASLQMSLPHVVVVNYGFLSKEQQVKKKKHIKNYMQKFENICDTIVSLLFLL